MVSVFNRRKCVVMGAASRSAIRVVRLAKPPNMEFEFWANQRSVFLCKIGTSVVPKNGKMSVSAQKQEHVGDWPPWATYSVSGDYAVASFDPCSCQRGKPQRVVRKEVVRFGSRGTGRTADEAKQELIKKVSI